MSDGKMESPETWMARAAMFELLSMGLLTPVPVLGEVLAAGDYADACVETAEMCGLKLSQSAEGLRSYAGRDADELFHGLRVEHTALFAKAPEPQIMPYIGVWAAREKGQRGQLFVGRESMEVERFMRRCGVAKDLSAGQTNDPLDHIGTVCEFMKYLCLVKVRAIAPAVGSEVCEDDFEVFHREHFRDYAVWCAGEIRRNDPSPFYAFVADALEQAAIKFV